MVQKPIDHPMQGNRTYSLHPFRLLSTLMDLIWSQQSLFKSDRYFKSTYRCKVILLPVVVLQSSTYNIVKVIKLFKKMPQRILVVFL